MVRKWTLDGLASELRDGKTSSRKLVEQALAKISDPAGEGARAFIKVDAEGALACGGLSGPAAAAEPPAIAIRRNSHFGEGSF